MGPLCRQCNIFLRTGIRFHQSSVSGIGSRAISTSLHRNAEGTGGASEGFFSKLFVRKIEPTKESHSTMLSDKEVIYEIVTHQVKPAFLDKYLNNYDTHVKLSHQLKISDLVASWQVGIGDQDQILHLWKYQGGYAGVDQGLKTLKENKEVQTLLKERLECLRQRKNQFILPFSYWPVSESKKGNNIYEIRSYILKPGTMIEWGNNWARAIQYRQDNDEAFAGFFSQVGRLYNVHHIWCYKDMKARKEAREASWRKPGWDECVAYTVPLIREMETKILLPTRFSPTQ